MEKRTQAHFAFICGRWPLDPDRSTLVFIHGAGAASQTWYAQVEGLKDRVNTVALDLPGHGRSGGTARQTVPDYALVLVEFIASIAAPAPIPCGLSMGGAITQQLLLDPALNFRAGIIVNSGARLKVTPSLFEWIETDMRRYAEMIDQLGFSAKTPPEIKEPFLIHARQASPQVLAGDFKACHAFDVMPRLSEIQAPVLIISAEDDRLTPARYGEYLEQHIPAGIRVHIRDAGHFAPVERPVEVNAAITGFLDAHAL